MERYKNAVENRGGTQEENHESNRDRAPHRRPGPGGDPQGNPTYYAYSGGRPVTDNIGMVGKVLLWDDGFVKKDRVELYMVTNVLGKTM